MKYAEGTTVPVDKSKAEIERIISKRGGDMVSFGYGRDSDHCVIGFRYRGMMLRFDMHYPSYDEVSTTTPRRFYDRDKQAALVQRNKEAEQRRLWRVMLIRIKVKLETVEENPQFWDEELLPHMLVRGGQNVVSIVRDALDAGTLLALNAGALPSQSPND